ncbi:MAG: hypothetical protein K2J73_13245, partial [Oscillospiraceae bacterium]|nr:hypothetical protein [Oscillospiraceae bacterium]
GGTAKELPVELENIPSYTVVNGIEPKITLEIMMTNFVYAPVEKRKAVGNVNFYSDGKIMCTVDLVTKDGCGADIHEHRPSIYENVLEWFKQLID